MLERTGRLLSCVFIFAVAGGHWGLMQVAAWSQMAAQSDSGSLIEVVFGTPCDSCRAVIEGSQQEKEDPQSAANAKGPMLAVETARDFTLYPPGVTSELDDQPAALSGIRLAPAHGPPRSC